MTADGVNEPESQEATSELPSSDMQPARTLEEPQSSTHNDPVEQPAAIPETVAIESAGAPLVPDASSSSDVVVPAEGESSRIEEKPSGEGIVAPAPSPVTRFGMVRAVVVVALTMAAVNSVLIARTLPLSDQGFRMRGLHHFYEIGQHLAAGLLTAGLVALWGKFGSNRILWQRLVLALVSLGLAIPILQPDLYAFAHRNASLRWAPVLLAALTFVGAMGVVIAADVSFRLSKNRPILAWMVAGVGAIVLILNHLVLRRDYFGVHFFLALYAAAFIAFAVASLRLPSWWPRFVAASPWIVSTMVATFTLVILPGNALLVEMLKVDGSVLAPWIARLSSIRRGTATVPPTARAWYSDRSKLPPIAASQPRLIAENPIILVISLDAIRADTVYSKKYDARFPTMVKLRDSSVDFTMARANGSQTVYSLTTMFTGTYFSQQYWVVHPKFPDAFPQEDKTPRFPKFLADVGFATVTVSASFFFNNEFGLMGGMTEEIYTKDPETNKSDPYAHGALVINDIIGRLKKQGAGPLFLYSHILDAHAPYNRGTAQGSEFERYIGEMEYTDRELARLLQVIQELGLASRTTLILTSDHGESFGEHGARTHGVNLYEELIRVPLFISIPGIKPRKVTTPVSLADIGPTILDLVGLPTPGYSMGQSLVPFFRGQNPTLTRPIIAETRLKKSLVMDDGYKIIIDDRSHTTEVYNLTTDPLEQRNLYDGPGSPEASRVELLQLFFDVHKIRKPGYVIPYRP